MSPRGAPRLRTGRLILEPFVEADIGELLRLFRDPEVRRYLLDDQLMDREWVTQEVASSQVHFETRGYGLWSLRQSDHRGIVGFVGYREFHEPPELQLVCGLLPQWWGKGFATEACREAIRFGFEELRFHRIVADADVANQRSVRLMDRLKMTRQGREIRSGLDTVCYSLRPEDVIDGLSRGDPSREGG